MTLKEFLNFDHLLGQFRDGSFFPDLGFHILAAGAIMSPVFFRLGTIAESVVLGIFIGIGMEIRSALKDNTPDWNFSDRTVDTLGYGVGGLLIGLIRFGTGG